MRHLSRTSGNRQNDCNCGEGGRRMQPRTPACDNWQTMSSSPPRKKCPFAGRKATILLRRVKDNIAVRIHDADSRARRQPDRFVERFLVGYGHKAAALDGSKARDAGRERGRGFDIDSAVREFNIGLVAVWARYQWRPSNGAIPSSDAMDGGRVSFVGHAGAAAAQQSAAKWRGVVATYLSSRTQPRLMTTHCQVAVGRKRGPKASCDVRIRVSARIAEELWLRP